MAQGAEAPANAVKACDLATASPYDKQRPADVKAVAWDALNTDVAIPACEAALRAAPKDPRVVYNMARAYRRAKRLQDAVMLFQVAAKKDNALAAFDLGFMYGKGEGVPVDLKAQDYYYEQAARAGLGLAAYNLGVIYGNGNAVVPKDEKIARQWLYFATNDNNNAAMAMLGFMLSKGIGGNKDEVEGRSWYEKGAQAGNFEAMALLGYDICWGVGGKKDQIEARRWFEKSASGNNATGLNNLGVMFEHGWGGPKDVDEARRLYQKASGLGNKLATQNLAKLDGKGAGPSPTPQPTGGGEGTVCQRFPNLC